MGRNGRPAASPQTLTILGSTGSIGLNTLEVVRRYPGRFKVRALAAGRNVERLADQIREFSPSAVYLEDSDRQQDLAEICGKRTRLFSRAEGIRAFSRFVDSDILVAAASGTSSLWPVVDAIRKGKRIALANKEVLVMAGERIMEELSRASDASLLPVDSEHSAIFQCLQGSSVGQAERLILTASGGPLRNVPVRLFSKLTKDRVINHPKWKMGRKISVDSATMMNKGLEAIEASALFRFPMDCIDVLIHPEAIVHSMVEFRDGSVLAQMGITDMKLPIQYALSYPDRLLSPPSSKLDFTRHSELTFSRADLKKFPCLRLAFDAGRAGGVAPCVLSAADEVAVNAFLNDQINFVRIPRIIERVLSSHRVRKHPTFDEIHQAHEWATEKARTFCAGRSLCRS